jgi:hypothetical protein
VLLVSGDLRVDRLCASDVIFFGKGGPSSARTRLDEFFMAHRITSVILLTGE